MLFRTLHNRLALLAILAAMLLVVMPTMSMSMSMSTAAVARGSHMPMGMDAPMPASRADAATAPLQQPMLHDGAHPAPPRPDAPAHAQGDCAYCPLLAGLLHWQQARGAIAAVPAAAAVAWTASQSAPARTGNEAHGARGPPALLAA